MTTTKKIPMEMRSFKNMDDAIAFARTIDDARVVAESWAVTFDIKGNPQETKTKIWVEYNFVEVEERMCHIEG